MKLCTDGNPVKLVFFCTSFCNDNAEQYALLGMSWMRIRGCCRICDLSKKAMNTTPSIYLDKDGTYRDSERVFSLIRISEAAFKNKLTRTGRGKRHKDELALEELTSLGISPGYNPIFEHFEWLRLNNITSIFLAGMIDNLHTLNKGPVEYVFKWTMTVIFVLNNKKDHVLARLDNRMRNLATNQSMNPFSKLRYYKNGVSGYFNPGAGKRKNIERSTISGVNLEAQEMPDIVFWLMFAIGTRNEYVVDKIIAPGMNPSKIIFSALTAVLEAVWCLRQRRLPRSYLEYVQQACNDMHVKLMNLFMLKQHLLETGNSMGSWKCHAITHVPTQVS
jgi:hypothetical protein